MTMTDPVADMLTRLRNANSAYHDTVSMPYSKLKARVADILKAEGFIAGWKEEDAEVGKKLTIDLKFGPNLSSMVSFLPTSASSSFQPAMKPSALRMSATRALSLL